MTRVLVIGCLALTTVTLFSPSHAEIPKLPINDIIGHPLMLFELGTQRAKSSEPTVKAYRGSVIAHSGDDYTVERNTDLVVARKGYAQTTATFRYALEPHTQGGQYAFWARFELGGTEPQSFTIRAGPNPKELTSRATVALKNTKAWKPAWQKADQLIPILPGDKTIEISTAGGATDAKVFDAFLLAPIASLSVEMTSRSGALRRRFLEATHKTPGKFDRRLYVLDGGGPQAGDSLFDGLADEAVRDWYASAKTEYLVGQQAANIAKQLNVDRFPAAIVTGSRNTVLGVLIAPHTAAEVTAFLRDPRGAGMLPQRTSIESSSPRPLRSGVPEAWLIAGTWGGLAGYSTDGLDAEQTLRPNPGEPFVRSVLLNDYVGRWNAAPTDEDGSCIIAQALDTSFAWARGTAYAHIYLRAHAAQDALLHVRHTGIRAAGWLDGRPFAFTGPTAALKLEPGWHHLLIKLNTQQDKDAKFDFKARFTDQAGEPLQGIETQIDDPRVDLALNRDAVRLKPLIYVNSPANLPHPGEPLSVRVDMRQLQEQAQDQSAGMVPIVPFQATLRLRMIDFDGRRRAVREVKGTFPGVVKVALGSAPGPGFYALSISLHAPDGRLIASFPADGFSVVRGVAAQLERLDKKKAWSSYYYMYAGQQFGNEERPYRYILPWMSRMGILQNLGSHWDFPKPLWEAAGRRGLVLTGDFQDPYQEDDATDKALLAQQIAPYTRYFKSFNEIDINESVRPSPERWVEFAHWDYDAVKAARPDAIYGGGSLARPAAPDVIDWFIRCLELGLDRYQDRWDVHAYPQFPPPLEGEIANSPQEADRGVLRAFEQIGRKNTLPFWLGETGALPWHGFNGLRWQADTTAKIVAWANSRSDFDIVAFCAVFAYARELSGSWDYAMGHRPGEAALYTASALIDGLPYRRIKTAAGIQAAWFGNTLMTWTTGGDAAEWQVGLNSGESWVTVDVVGRVRSLAVGADRTAMISVASSPVYVLTRNDYERLTRFQ